MLEAGFLVMLGLLVMLAKLPWRSKLWVTSHPLLMDAIVFVLLIVIHWGTFAGVMAATVGSLFCSIVLSVARRVVGYMRDGKYVRGMFDVAGRMK